jgi:hypothetical protein
LGARALVIASISSRLHALKQALADVGWEVHAFQNPNEALEALTSQAVDAVFCDEHLRGASPAGFFAWTQRAQPKARFYLVGAASSTPAHQRSRYHGVVSFPLERASLPAPPDTAVSTPNPSAPPKSEVPLTGNTDLIPLDGLVEMMGLARQRAVLELAPHGRIYVHDGYLMHAESRGARGLAALAQLLRTGGCTFRVLPFEAAPRNTINLPVSTALSEAARLLDERRRIEVLVSAIEAHCPAIEAVAAGYLLASAPEHSRGDDASLFQSAKALLEQARSTLGSKPFALDLATEQKVIAVRLVGNDVLLSARAPLGARRQLAAAMDEALHQGN